MSCPLYDLSQLMKSEHPSKAIRDQALYDKLIAHRTHFICQRDINYTKHSGETIDFRVLSKCQKNMSRP